MKVGYRYAVGRRISAVMATQGVSARELEEGANISPGTLSRYRNGHNGQRFEEMARIAAYLGANLHYLAYGDMPMLRDEA
jgi:transcriptional regulator with XRE-family HTH domain